ncbi:nicotinate-nucleotide--dimethylbenzimidazole phosphoribosyltransferase [Alloalcanivorax xenomutans]|uniref:Nicotinate-nucleotide--dimethylbenzimidazole phosphoribosyltransferase n=1 Tax=Alloalcanivorax xenomutans TaxID=1094342 RepID=A0A9Q3W348_9GAMM|nr:nicotinate-nucleotide--dimethylbenzimidazole phosphoribosyltransferase [Alloalcanivorax xenomutans]ERS14137.1 nicotinate-nucleotide--dimethylbenzimidazole phosphoribosyltransferase [Alcanivorax sp. PN-3]MCE7508119.1 nicotinate-nucleotide--dimethylbenzimidazole phosphoribosyltransferase [Alloalcanivorax xenomutans]MCE7523370.1 nicotinate-nucleotide--dimethylbenzimidazole phosphoribosyltransferase [Alloalcanivorax xenomutans]CUR48023.1 Nicotinate-nucleotide--dimethylbenzimidazole phosphoribosy
MSVSSPFWRQSPPSLNPDFLRQGRQRQASLTKPAGSLGRLEQLAITLSAQQQRPRPAVDRVRIVVFAADHGVCAEGVSAFPQEVTGQMIANFVNGGAAISVLARHLGAELEVVNLGTAHPLPARDGVVMAEIAPGTANLATAAAMSEEQLQAALSAGRDAVQRAAGAELFIGGEMGIGNTTAAAAVACALLDLAPEVLAGPGTGLDADGLRHKVAVLHRALQRHRDTVAEADQPLPVLASLGGFEVAALAGAFLAAAQTRIPVLVDGFIASVAALAATRLQPGLAEWLHFAHQSAEPGHARVLAALDADPLLRLNMRLGEGSGAAAAVPLLRQACALHNQMASFQDAGISKGQ